MGLDAGSKQAGASPLTGVVPPPEHRFKPGQSGNPKGRPKGARTKLERLVQHELKRRGEDGLTKRQRGARAVADKFAAGDPKFVEIVLKLDRPDEPLVNVQIGEGADVHVHEAEAASSAIDVVFEVLGRE